MRLPRFSIVALVTFLIVVILNVDVGFPSRLLGGGLNWQLIQPSQVLAQTSEERKAEADRLFQRCSEQIQISQFEAALQSCQQALTIYRVIKDRSSEGGAIGLLGMVHFALGNYPQAIDNFEQLLAIARETNNRLGEGAALGSLGQAYLALGNYSQAVDNFEQLLVIARESNNRLGEGAALGSLGQAYLALGNYPQAINYFEQLLAIAREIRSRQDEGAALGSLGQVYYALGDYAKAIDYFEQLLGITREIKDRNNEGKALGGLGNAYNSLGDYAKAIEYLQQSLTIAQEIKDRQGEGVSLSNLGNTYYLLGDYTKAIDYYQQHLAIAQEIKDRRGEGDALTSLGNAYNSLGNHAKAIEYLQQSLTIAQEIKNRQGEATALGNLGNAYYFLGDYANAINYHQQRLAITQEIKDRLGEGQSLANLGIAYDSLEDYAAAIKYHQQSLAILREIKDPLGEGNVLNNLGFTLYKSGNLSAAEQTLLDGIKVYESIRGQLGSNDVNKVSIFETQARVYRTLQRVLIAQNKIDTALEISERGRARAFVELLTSRLSSNPTESVNIAPPTINQLKQISKDKSATLVEYSIIYDDFNVQDKLQVKELELYIWVIKPTGEITFRKADLKPLWQQQDISLTDLVYSSRNSIGVRGRGGGIGVSPDDPNQTQRLHQLHQLLIEPIADLLPTDPTARVIFLPQSSLFLVPFPALQDASGQSLIEQHTILTAPAIQILDLTHEMGTRNREQETGNTLIVGNPTMPKVVFKVGEPPQQLSSLPGAEKEAREIAKLLKTDALTGNQATKTRVVEQMKNARMIHLATHGLLDDFKGLGIPGAIALAPSANDNGLLTANDIFDLKLNAELVVLSACDTGQGRVTGDGVIGLSRSLISAGVPSIVVSLWSVSDDSTAFLMTEFYKNLQQKIDKAQALRLAMLATKKQYPDPLFWAAFTLIGEVE